jgi:hypothetical protein
VEFRIQVVQSTSAGVRLSRAIVVGISNVAGSGTVFKATGITETLINHNGSSCCCYLSLTPKSALGVQEIHRI